MQSRDAGPRAASISPADREIFDYLCTECGSSVGRREVTAGEKMMAQAMAGRTRRAPVSVRLR